MDPGHFSVGKMTGSSDKKKLAASPIYGVFNSSHGRENMRDATGFDMVQQEPNFASETDSNAWMVRKLIAHA